MSKCPQIDSVICAPPIVAGGVKSLYSVCEWLNRIGRSSIVPLWGSQLVSWFDHSCKLLDDSYLPEVLIYPEVFQPYFNVIRFHVCYALGKYAPVEPHADLVVCKSPNVVAWVKQQHPQIPTALIPPSIDRSIFSYDGRPKSELICFMTRPHKHPETALLLQRRYGDKFLEIIDYSETEVAETLKNARVFVWHGNDKEGSPRPPKEALVAGCVVVGLKSDLHEDYLTDFGVKCSDIDELVEMAGEALKMPLPTEEERAVVRDKSEEMRDWLAVIRDLTLNNRRYRQNIPAKGAPNLNLPFIA